MAALARPHGHLSNRARVRSTLERKPVFKNVLENPFQIRWPSVPVDVQDILLTRLVTALENIPPRPHSSRKSPQKTRRLGRHVNVSVPEETEHTDGIQSNPSQAPDQECADLVPGSSPCFIVGINAVTRALELQLRATHRRIVMDGPSQDSDQPSLRAAPSPIVVVFACCADVDPLVLLDHIPHLIAGCNSPRNVTHLVKLVPLPTGSEQSISRILGVRRAAVVALRHGSSASETIRDILESVPTVRAPWLCPSDTQVAPQFVPTHIKQLRTTAPKDMKAAREQRSKARIAARKGLSGFSRSVHRKPRVTLTTE